MTKIIQSIVYRKNLKGVEFLILKRNKERGGFWSFVNGTLEHNESFEECRERELFEEVNVRKILHVSPLLRKFNFTNHDKNIEVYSYGVQIYSDQEIIINAEHVDYKWCYPEDIKEWIRYEDDFNSFCELKKILSI